MKQLLAFSFAALLAIASSARAQYPPSWGSGGCPPPWAGPAQPQIPIGPPPRPSARQTIPRSGRVEDAVVLVTTSNGFAGSGTNVDPAGLVITARHVAAHDQFPTVHFPDGKSYRATAVALDDAADLAAISFEAEPGTPATRVASGEPGGGDKVWLVGYPRAGPRIIGEGQVKYIRPGSERLMEVSTLSWPGDSGGGLFTSNGSLAGVLSAGDSKNGGGPGLCVPWNEISSFCCRWPRARVVVRGRGPVGVTAGPQHPGAIIANRGGPPTTAPALPGGSAPLMPVPAPAPVADIDAAVNSGKAMQKDITELKVLIAKIESKASIPGKDGADGKPGQAGPQGPPGPLGPAGKPADESRIAVIEREIVELKAKNQRVRVVPAQP